MTELWQLSAGDLLTGYRSREFSPREAVDALAGRIEALDPSLGAFWELCLERARAEAGAPRAGPLAGVPFAAKDLFDSAEVRTTYGSPMFATHVPSDDAAAVAALRAAGAILVGKTQTHEFAWGITSINEAMGSARNPWDPARVPGGSSGGSGAALGARMVPLALGTDTGGSIRIPAAFCGVLGFKPTYGRLDASGAWPLAPSLDHVGPMARTPGDLALAFAVLDGSEPVETAGAAAASLDGATVVTCPELGRVEDAVVAVLEGLGATVVERSLTGADGFDDVFRVVQAHEALAVHCDAGLFPGRTGEYGPDVRRRLEYAATLDPAENVRAASARERLRSAFGRLVAGGALLVTPVSAVQPIRAADDREDAGRRFRTGVLPYTAPDNLVGAPSCAVRAGFDAGGLPVGIQIAAAPGRDEAVLRAVAAFYEATPEIQAPWPA